MALEKLTSLAHLEQIDLSFNSLRFLRRRWFDLPPPSLKSLILKGNHIEAVEDRALRNAQALIFLDLSENRIHSLYRWMLPDKLEIIHLEYVNHLLNHLQLN